MRIEWLLLFLAVCGTAQAGPYSVGGSQTVARASNLLLLPEDQVEPEGYSRSDTLHATALTAALDQPLGRQRLLGDVTWRNERYESNRLFNNSGYSLNLALEIATVERITGRLQAGATRSLASFGLGTDSAAVTQRNLQDGRQLDGLLRWGLDTRWTLEGGLGERRIRNSLDAEITRRRDLDETHGSLALRWAAGLDLSLALAAQRSRGSYPNYLATAVGYQSDRYVSDTWAFDVGYAASAKSRFDLRLARTGSNYDLNQARSFSGFTGSLRGAWSPSAKIGLALRWARDTGQDSAQFGNKAPSQADPLASSLTGEDTRASTTQHLRMDYAASAKLSLVAQWQRVQRQTVRRLGVQGAVPLAQIEGQETLENWGLGARWSPGWRWQMGCDLSADQRRADAATGYSYSNTRTTCFVQYTGL
jgi:hypothetical protein